MKRSIPILLSFVTGASLMADSAAQDVQRQCKRDLPQVGKYDLYQCAVEEYGLVPPRGGGYGN